MIDRRTLIGNASTGSMLFAAAMSLPRRAGALPQAVSSGANGELIDLAEAGVLPGNDARRNTAIFQAVVANAPTGATLVLPAA